MSRFENYCVCTNRAHFAMTPEELQDQENIKMRLRKNTRFAYNREDNSVVNVCNQLRGIKRPPDRYFIRPEFPLIPPPNEDEIYEPGGEVLLAAINQQALEIAVIGLRGNNICPLIDPNVTHAQPILDRIFQQHQPTISAVLSLVKETCLCNGDHVPKTDEEMTAAWQAVLSEYDTKSK